MKVKITGVVKVGGRWRRPGDVLDDVNPEVAQQIVGQGVGQIMEEESEATPKAEKRPKRNG